jgi:catechol 2,3-dioxygenase-like lactoylglutathione lyase family enzyme
MKLMFKTKIKETGGKVAWLRSPRSKQILELNWYPKNYKFGGKSGLDHLAFKVEDAEKIFVHLAKKKYKAPIKPFLEGSWMLAYVKDPDGNWIELGQVTRKRRK